MPTTHVEATSGPLLQDVADTLAKSRKIVVVTGAGISTNSGIPDFRSRNGLYSLIQARLDATSKDSGTDAKTFDSEFSDPIPSQYQEGPPPKRRRLVEVQASITTVRPSGSDNVADGSSTIFPTGVPQDNRKFDHTERPQLPGDSAEEQPTAYERCQQLSTAPQVFSTDDLGATRSGTTIPTAESSVLVHSTPSKAATDSASSSTPTHSPDYEAPGTVPFISSPLSSPPPVLFDPYDNSSSPCTRTASRRHSVSSTSSADSSRPDPSAQSSFSGRSALPRLKGKDLFDASIWADPVKTSVFYTFATELRRKTKDAEPTSSHRFISQLRDCGKLVRCYTQNIDEIEEKVGLVTGLDLGPGSRGRFSLRGGGNRASIKPAEDSTDTSTETSIPTDTGSVGEEKQLEKVTKPPPKRDAGVECVYLHGSLNSLRCFTCGQTSDWDEGDREDKTLSGQQPRCPHCEAATAARQGRGKRALGIGKLRPDIVLYGEEHPKAHLISPIVQHDLALCPDMMIILGTSLRVHGLKVMVREFAKTIHNRGGKVVFVNLTKPPDSVWSDIIDYWIQWDCDAWVQDLKERKPVLWLPPGSVLPEEKKAPRKRKLQGRESSTASLALLQEASQISLNMDEKPLEAQPQVGILCQALPAVDASNATAKKMAAKVRKPIYKADAKYPAAVRDCRRNGAYLVCKIMGDLASFAGRTRPPSVVSSDLPPPAKPIDTKRKPPRKTASASLGAGRDRRAVLTFDSTDFLKPAKRRKSAIDNVGAVPPVGTSQLPGRGLGPATPIISSAPSSKPVASSAVPNPTTANGDHSILAAVKSNPRKRKRKTINGVEVSLPTVTPRGSKGPDALPSIASILPDWTLLSEDKENLTEYSPKEIPPPRGRPALPPLITPKLSRRPGGMAVPRIAPIECFKSNSWSVLPRPEPLHADSTWQATMVPISPPPNLGSPMAREMRKNAFILFDPLVNLLRQPPLSNDAGRGWVDASSKVDWGPSDQLWSEHGELNGRDEA